MSTINKSSIPLILTSILFLISLIFSGIIAHEFVNWDDYEYIHNNALIKSLSFDNIIRIFSSRPYVGYLPITITSYAINYSIGELNPFNYLLCNLILHLINTILVYLFCNLLLNNYKNFINSNAAIFIALIFGIHPMHIESIAWISERKDLLYTLFFIASCIFYIKYINSKRKKEKILYFSFSLILYSISTLSKAMAIILPFILIIIDYIKCRELLKWKIIKEKIPFLLITIIWIIVILFVLKGEKHIHNLPKYTFIKRIVFAIYAFSLYIIKLTIPFNLSTLYIYPSTVNEAIPYYIYLFIIPFLLFIFITYKYRHNREVIFGSLFFTICISLVLQIFQYHDFIMADRYSYLSSIGFYIILAFILNKIYLKLPIAYKWIFHVLFISYLLFLSSYSFIQCKVWANSKTLFTQVLKHYPTSRIAYNNRGLYNKNNGEYENAINDFNKAIALSPIYTDAYNNRGNAFYEINEYEKAINDYNIAISIDSTKASAYINRSRIYSIQRNYNLAIADLNNALRLSNKSYTANFNRGLIYMKMGEFKKALSDFNIVLLYDDMNNRALFHKAVLLYHFGEKEKACIYWKKSYFAGNKKAATALSSYCK